MSDLDAFRAETRAWLEANCPASMRTPMPDREVVWGGRNPHFSNPDSKVWLEAMASRGWTAPLWPKAYGGGGLSNAQNAVLQDELKRIKARPAILSFGIWMFGPVILEYGTEEQKLTYLPDMVHGRTWWCQGYSEPGAGSDLAGLQTRAVDDGDAFIVNGQKVWTSYANHADWMLCLVRTNPDAPKHEGISVLLFDMKTPGVEVRPIKLISGASPFCETFLTDVRVPKPQMLGTLNKGWDVAKRILQYERTNISASGFGGGAGLELVAAAKEQIGLVDGVLADRDLRSRITRQKMYERAFNLSMKRAADEAKAGGEVSHYASVLKIAAAKLNQDKTELMVEALGMDGLGWEGDGYDAGALKATRDWLRAKANSIEGGTSEVNLNIVAKRVLGLRDHQ
ncbi:MAG: acyl-CoA dehydrogenase family protein [Hyphomonadaceae bacterium]|jgi:alkylation response protein AidB-like acyl-CoA dehydrogenase|nr:acyl-CoA dehydrogenase family protein [Hyphomonadaceae bacterium]